VVGSPEAVVSGTVGERFAGQASCRRHACGGDGQRWCRLATPGQNVENDIGGIDALAEGFGAGDLDGVQPVGQNGAEDVDHLAVAVRHPAELALHAARLSALRAPVLAVINPGGRVVPAQSILAGLSAAACGDPVILTYRPEPGPALQHLGPLLGFEAHRELWPHIAQWLSA
jgi:hypothetical protein